MIRSALLAALALLAPLPAMAQQSDGTVTARQVFVPIDQVLGRGKAPKPPKEEVDALKEQRRHNRDMEKQLRSMVRNDRFRLPTGKVKPARLKTLPPWSNRY